MKVEIYSDVVCPWCYIGERRLARALAAFPGTAEVEVVFRPYQLDPDAPERAVPIADYLTKRFGDVSETMQAQVSAAAESEGIVIEWDRAQATNTRTAHRLLRLAEREYGGPVQRVLAEHLFDMHFTRGGDVGDVAELTDAAVAAGMDRQRVATYLESDEGAAELDAEFERARGIGIRGVPTFVFDNRFVVQGAQPATQMLRVLHQVAQADSQRGGGSAPGSDAP